ncbi:MAG: phage tail protein [Nitrospirae bacterium GWC2_56_14]|nr:MAG: phage tail protein [Nitrospirae bacterium GWC2_56_14]
MPEYLAPGVFVEEVSYRSKSIEGVSTTTTGFVGPTRYGAVDMAPDIITSVLDFERVYGDRQKLVYNDEGSGGPYDYINYLWHAVRAFFEEGGKRLYVSRVFLPLGDSHEINGDGLYPDGHARASIPSDGGGDALGIRARFPGAAGNMRVRITLRLGQNILGEEKNEPAVKGLVDNDIVLINDVTSPPLSPPQTGDFYIAESYYDETNKKKSWRFKNTTTSPAMPLSSLTPSADPNQGDSVRVVTATVTVAPADEGSPMIWNSLPLDPAHQRAGSPDSLTAVFGRTPANLSLARTLPIIVEAGTSVTSGLDILGVLFSADIALETALKDILSSDADRSIDAILVGGNDGQRPSFAEYEGTASDDDPFKTGLKAFEDIEDISIVAAPGSTYGYENGYRSDAATITSLLISHAERMRYRIAVLDSGNGQTISQVRAMRARIDSKHAAFYYPWVTILDPVTRQETPMPPSGFVAGIYARNDTNRGVIKAPANEVVNLALGFESMLNKGQQEVLNPEGINCFRFFEGRGNRLWGARTISSDPEWKYVNIRRYFAYLERSIDKGTQWAVFEPNGEALWANIRRTIEDFLLNEWQSGALLGDKPDKAYFVRCDRSTMTQNDLDNGRLIAQIGVSALKPAEFVILRIGQWTADRKN